jgi:hypothetical protein
MIDPDTTVDGMPAHSACIAKSNECMACGIDRGDCGDPRCYLSERYAGPPGEGRVLRTALLAAWLSLPREERARRLGQPLTERMDGWVRRLSHDDGVEGSGMWEHVGTTRKDKRAALAALTEVTS